MHISDPHSVQIVGDVVGLALQTGHVVTSREVADPAYMTPASKTPEELPGQALIANYAVSFECSGDQVRLLHHELQTEAYTPEL